MGSSNQVVLASTLHDPENRLSSLIEKYHQVLKEIFNTIIVVTSPKTHPDVYSLIDSLNLVVHCGEGSIVSNYRASLEHAKTTNKEHIFYCDFDRALHWIDTYPEELSKIVRTGLSHDFILYGRTNRAFQTHPTTQTATEGIVNRLCSHILGYEVTRDIISACWRLSTKLAQTLIQLPTNTRYGFYVEWPIHAWSKAENPRYIKVEGLEWETPDRYRPEIQKIGYEKWLQSFQTSGEWEKRVEILREVIESSLRVRTSP